MPHLSCITLPAVREAAMPQSLLLCLGNFDGVHLAHRRLLCAAKAWRDREFPGVPVGVFCFRELPSDVLLPEPPGHLCTADERLERFAECGMEYAVLADFPELRNVSPEDYVQTVLVEQCHCVAAACGFNHRFGRGGAGTPELLRRILKGRLLLQEPVLDGGEPVSSTRIRALLAEGQPEEAARLLAHPYTLCAPVLHGKALGRTIGVPTVNQNFPEHAMLLRFGVYATACVAQGRRWAGVSNVGIHPTVDRNAPANCETYLLDFSGDLYGQTVEVSFLQFLRPERKFASVDALKAQIRRDAAAVRSLFAGASGGSALQRTAACPESADKNRS